jgi:hypothetical protein
MPAAFLTDFRRYANLIESGLLAAPPAFVPSAESDSALQVERGIVYPTVLLHPADPPHNTPLDPLLKLSTDGDLTRLASYAVIDRTGHHRPVYRGLLLYAALQSFHLAYEKLTGADFGRWEEGLRPWADLLESELTRIDWPAEPANQIPALLGAAATDAAFMALALHVAGKLYVRDAWTDLASDTFGKIIRCQQADGTFLTATASDNPETHWYHELVLLHAATSYAVQAEDRALAAAVVKNSDFHQRETQPDHATNQPWALFAFIWNPQTRPLADQLLHTATTVTGSGLTSILLADALYCLRLFNQ